MLSTSRRRQVGLAASALVLFLAVQSIGTTRAADRFIAYAVTAGSIGNQAYGGSLGMEFEVVNPVIVTRLGVFDDGSDGLNRPLTAYLYDRTDPDAPVALASLEFTTEDAGELIGGSRFKDLAEPIRLEAGFRGTIVAENYGEGEQNRNSGGDTALSTWTLNDGNGSLQFVGSSRYGTMGEYPFTADGGPADRYGAGTFEFEVTPPARPGTPVGLSITPGDQQLTIAWIAVTNPLPAAKYELRRGDSREGPFTSVGESSELTFTDPALTNGRISCYQIVAISATGEASDPSATICAAPYVPAAGQRIAYAVQAGLVGTQEFDGSIGMDFEVANAILVTHLGVFDDGSDGLGRIITARLWDRSTPDAPVELAALEFTPEAPGELINGSRFLAVPSPIRLEPGLLGTISVENYGPEERLYNPGAALDAPHPWTLDDGDGSFRFAGVGRYSTIPGEFPGSPDGGPADRYGAGTFQFQTTELINPAIVSVSAARGDLAAVLSWEAIPTPVPAARYRIFRSRAGGDPTQLAEVDTPGYTDTGLTKGDEYCYTVSGISAAGTVGAPSVSACLTAEAREPGVAYIVLEGTVGTQNFGGALGLDFDVLAPVNVTRLGVFDDSSDGLFLPISARLYNRTTLEVLASLDFTPEEPGDLVGGSRFKNLPAPVVLPAGFQGSMVASGYGDDERNGNVGVVDLAVFTGGGALAFVGSARYGTDPASFPDTLDGGPVNRYAAGTFYFEPGVAGPELEVARTQEGIVITWTGGGVLESAQEVHGTWSQVTGGTSGGVIQPAGTAAFYRVRQ